MMRSPSAARRAMWLVVRCIGPKACPSEPIRERTRANRYSPVIGVPSTRHAGPAEPPFELADSGGPIDLWAASGDRGRYQPHGNANGKGKHRGQEVARFDGTRPGRAQAPKDDDQEGDMRPRAERQS